MNDLQEFADQSDVDAEWFSDDVFARLSVLEDGLMAYSKKLSNKSDEYRDARDAFGYAFYSAYSCALKNACDSLQLFIESKGDVIHIYD